MDMPALTMAPFATCVADQLESQARPNMRSCACGGKKALGGPQSYPKRLETDAALLADPHPLLFVSLAPSFKSVRSKAAGMFVCCVCSMA